MDLSFWRQNSQVNPDMGSYVEMEDNMEVSPAPTPGSKMDQTVIDLKQMFPDVPSSKMISLCNLYNCNIPFIVEQLLCNPDKYTDDVENVDANKSSASTSVGFDPSEEDPLTKSHQMMEANKILKYLHGIFPDADPDFLQKKVLEFGDDPSKYESFLSSCFADPSFLPRVSDPSLMPRAVQSSGSRSGGSGFNNNRKRKNSRSPSPAEDVELDYLQDEDLVPKATRLVEGAKSSVVNQPIQLNGSRSVSGHKSSKSTQSIKKGKSLSKKGSPSAEPHYVCPLCKEDCPMSEAVKCNSGCFFCMLCTIRHFRASTKRKIGSVDCFLSCGETFNLDNLEPFLPPILFNNLLALNTFLESLDMTNNTEPEEDNRSSSSRKSTDDGKSGSDDDDEDSDVQILDQINGPEKSYSQDQNCNISASSTDKAKRRKQDDDIRDTGSKTVGDFVVIPSYISRDNSNIEHHLLKLAVETEITPRDPSMKGFIEEKPPSPSFPLYVPGHGIVCGQRGRGSFFRGRGRGRGWKSFDVDDMEQIIGGPGGRGRGSISRGRGRGRGVNNLEEYMEWFDDEDGDNWGWSGGRGRGQHVWKKQYNENHVKKDKEVVSILTALTKELEDLKTLSENDATQIFGLLENSALLPFIESKLESCNFLEIERHANVYRY